MAKDRTIKELLQLTLEQLIVEKDLYGICGVIWDLYINNSITYLEHTSIERYLRNNLPARKYSKHPGFCWKPGCKACRIKWLQKQINSL